MTTISAEHAEDLFCGRSGGETVGPWTAIEELAHERRRWMQAHTLILLHQDGTHWALDYDLGLTEEQPHELPWRNSREPVELTRVYPHEVVTVEYRTTPPAAGR